MAWLAELPPPLGTLPFFAPVGGPARLLGKHFDGTLWANPVEFDVIFIVSGVRIAVELLELENFYYEFSFIIICCSLDKARGLKEENHFCPRSVW